MNRTEIINQATELEKEIQQLKDFMRALQNEDTVSPQYKWTSVFLKKETTLSFIGVWRWRYHQQNTLPIPDKLRIEIYAMCQKWLNELDKRANRLLNIINDEQPK